MRKPRAAVVTVILFCCLGMECPSGGSTGGVPLGGGAGGSDRDFSAMPRMFIATDRAAVAAFDMPRTIDGSPSPDEFLVTSDGNQLVQDVVVNGIGNLITLKTSASSDNTRQINVYSDAGSIDGSQSPIRMIGGAATRLDGNIGGTHVDMKIDVSRDILYVSHQGDLEPGATGVEPEDVREVLVFEGTSQASFDGNVAPNRVIMLGDVGTLAAITVDSQRDILYVFVSGERQILVFDNASTRDGMATPDRVIDSDEFGTNLFGSLLLDRVIVAMYVDAANDTLYAFTKDRIVFKFENASTLDGDLSGIPTFGLVLPSSIDPDDFVSTDLYVDSQGIGYFHGSPAFTTADRRTTVLIVDDVSSASGSTDPDRVLDLDVGEFAQSSAMIIAE